MVMVMVRGQRSSSVLVCVHACLLGLACADPATDEGSDASDGTDEADGIDGTDGIDEADGTDGTETAATDTDSSDEATTTADAGTDSSSDAGTDTGPGEDELCAGVTPTPRPRPQGTAPGAESPFGAGDSADVILGALDDPGAVTASIAPGGVLLEVDLDGETYDVHVPAGYDGTEPYGLIAFINSGNNGSAPSNAYAAELAQRRVIWIAPDGVGNAVDVTVRMGRAYLGTLRAMELFNVDPGRVYAMGSSGGARSANMLAYQVPELYTGVLARCGANYPAMVEQAYETEDLDSHYEFWGPGWFPDVGGQPYLDYLRGLERRFALMVSFDDFREGDVMNIYHHGFEADGLLARLIETSGNHCSTNQAHLRDGLGFVEHPLYTVVDERFDDGNLATNPDPGQGWLERSDPAASIGEGDGALQLQAPAGTTSAALVRDRTHWFDRHGAIVRAQLELGDAAGGRVDLGVLAHDPELHGGPNPLAPVTPGELEGQPALEAQPAVFVSLVEAAGQWRVVVEVHAPDQGDPGVAGPVFEAVLDDFDPAAGPLGLKLELWDRELQLDLDRHLLAPALAEPGTRLLDDGRTVRVRWDELLGAPGWADDAWPVAAGSVLSLALTAGEGQAAVSVDSLSVVDAVGFACED